MSSDPDLLGRMRALTRPLMPLPTDQAPRLEPIAGVRAVLFDVYGTLIISASGDIGLEGGAVEDADPLPVALSAAGIEAGTRAADVHGPDRLRAAIRTRHAEAHQAGIDFPEVDILEVWGDLLTELGLKADAAERRRLAVEYEFRVNAVWPMPGLAELLAALRARGLVLGIVSNAQFYTPLMLELFLGASLDALGFDPDCCAWSYRLGEGKPSRDIYRQALAGLDARYGITPAEVLYIGNDMRNDVWPAAAVGLRTVLFAGDARSLRLRRDDPRVAAVVPERVVTALAQIERLLLPA
jgi:putative hydrolase of the HAD superfamily